MRVSLIRHGLTALGESGRYQGRIDEPLSDKGRASLRTAEVFPPRVYTSPAKRAAETAAILFPKAEQIPVEELWEMNFGAFEGRGWWEMDDDPQYRAWIDGNCRGQCPGGEDMETFTERVCRGLQRILAREIAEESGGTIVVAHGGIQMAALSCLGDGSREFWQWQTDCGCGWLLDWDGERLHVLRELNFLR